MDIIIHSTTSGNLFKNELGVPYLYLKKYNNECITALFKDKEDGSVLLRIYKSDKGFALHLDDVNSIALIHKTRFNKFMLMDYNAPDEFYKKCLKPEQFPTSLKKYLAF